MLSKAAEIFFKHWAKDGTNHKVRMYMLTERTLKPFHGQIKGIES